MEDTVTCCARAAGVRQRTSSVLLAACLAAASCAQSADATRATALEDIERLIGAAACKDDSQCRTIGVGARACGGPERYLAWSLAQTNSKALQNAAERYSEQRRKEIQKLGLMSTCQVLPVPGVHCEKQPQPAISSLGGRCVLGGTAAQ